MMDSVFSLPSLFNDSYYGFVIHEIREMHTPSLYAEYQVIAEDANGVQ